MHYNKLSKILFKELESKLKNHKGLLIFAKQRAKFEGWLKVEMCEILTKYFDNVIPEDKRIDITFGNWAIELKTVNTSYRYDNVININRPITKNVNSIIKDIKALKKNKKFKNKAVLFITFPVEHNQERWELYLKKITKELKDIKICQFKFNDDNIPGIIYFGLV